MKNRQGTGILRHLLPKIQGSTTLIGSIVEQMPYA
jgi:hypothetical protein